MTFRVIPARRLKKAKSGNSQEVLDRLKEYLDKDFEEPVRVLCGFWEEQQNAISYQELRQAVKDGAITNETLDLWRQDYSLLVKDKLSNLWTDAIAAGPSGQPILDGLPVEINMQRPGIRSWINERGASFVTACTQEQGDAIAALLSKKMKENHTVDELSRMIRPCIGLTEGQAVANARYYDNVVATLKKEHPRMSSDSIRKKALDASSKYAEKQHRQRAFSIAQTESAFAFNRGADEGVRQAQEEQLLGKCRKRWSTSGDEGVCPICSSLEGAEIEINENFNFPGKVLFTGHKMLPPAHPRCACALEYIEVEPPKFLPEPIAVATESPEENIRNFEEEQAQAQMEYDSHFEGQKLSPEAYKNASYRMAEDGYEYPPERVVQMVDSVYTYTQMDYTDILAAQTNFSGRLSSYASTVMTEERRIKALQDAANIEEFLEVSPPYSGPVFRGLGFDVGGPMDNGGYQDFMSKYKKGAKVNVETLSSWTTDERVLNQFHAARTGVDEELDYAVEVTIRMKDCKSGVEISEYSEMKNQKEVLFSKNTSLLVKNVTENWKDDELLQVFIDVEEIF